MNILVACKTTDGLGNPFVTALRWNYGILNK